MDGSLAAGEFAAWLDELQGALEGDGSTDVPCATCTACCRARQFVHVAPDEHDALAHLPSELLFPAPRLPAGHVVIGYDEQGRCPMLGDHGCTIYEHRPRTCRTYDCRIFAAAGVEPDHPAVAERVQRWRFEHADDASIALHDSVRLAASAAARADHANNTQLALTAVRVVMSRR